MEEKWVGADQLTRLIGFVSRLADEIGKLR